MKNIAASIREGFPPTKPFGELYVDLMPVVRGVVKALCHPNDVEDLVQITFIKIYEKLDTVRNGAALKAWARRVAVNTVRDHQRKTKRAQWLCYMDPSELPEKNLASQAEDIRVEDRELIRLGLRALPPVLHQTMALYSLEQQEIKTIAATLHVSEGTVKARLKRARRRLSFLK